MAHALLSPSSASRWLVCTRSARFEEQFPDRAGEAAAEGTLAHSLGELLIKKALGTTRPGEFKKRLAQIETDPLYKKEMREYCEQYAAFVLERFAAAKSRSTDAVIHLEQRLDLAEFIPEGFGTSDVVIIADGYMEVIDLKYGKGVPVSAVDNKQMRIYALGALAKYSYLYAIDEVAGTIFQPRLDNISGDIWNADDLMAWGTGELTLKARQAWNDEGEFVAGSHCRFCRAAGVCRENARHNLEIARYEFQEPARLAPEEIADIMFKAEDFTAWLKAVLSYAQERAKAGDKFPGWKLVAGRSNRVITDEAQVAQIIEEKTGLDPYEPRKLMPIGKLEALVGKTKLPALVGHLIAKPPGAPTLAPANDKRPEIGSADSARADFADDLIEN